MTSNMIVLCAACALAGGAMTGFATATDRNDIVHMPPGDMHWERTAEGVGFAPLQGNRFAGAYMAMVRLPAGLVSPAHTKTATMYGIVMEGTLANSAVGADPALEVALPEGSYYEIPAGLPHVSKCLSETDCVTFLYQDGKFDFLPLGQ